MSKKRKNNPLASFMNWLENGGNALDDEMQDALREDAPAAPARENRNPTA